MAIIKSKEIAQMDNGQKAKKLTELKDELMRLYSQKSVGKTLQNPGKVKEIKRTIARLLTIKEIKIQEVKKKV